MTAMSPPADAIVFGRFTLERARRAVMFEGRPVPLSSRAFDILCLLIEHRDRVVTKDEILREVWRGMIVEENNLAVQVSALRRALAETGETATLIATVPGQGYRFVGAIGSPAPTESAPAPSFPLSSPNLPAARPGRRLPVILTAVAAAVALAAAAWFMAPGQKPRAEPPRLSIAVLPFRNLGESRADDYLADAISDDLTTDLAHIPDSVVIARESSEAYRGRAVPTADIGRALNVRYLLEGSLRAADGQYLINAQLIEAASGAHLWAQRFAVPREKISQTQEAIVDRLASALDVSLVAAESRRLAREHANPDTVALLLQARSILDRSDTLAAMTEAQHLLERALALEPGNAEVLSALAGLLLRKTTNFHDPDDGTDTVRARDYLNQALAAAPRNPAALVEKGFLLSRDENWAAATPIFQQVLTLDPGNLRAHIGLQRCYAALGRYADAEEEARAALRLDPESARTRVILYHLGVAQFFQNKPAAALESFRRSQAADPDPQPGADELGRIEWGRLLTLVSLWETGDHDRAEAMFHEYNKLWPHRTIFRLTAQFWRADARSPGFRGLVETLVALGMPRFADEDEPAAPAQRRRYDPLPAPPGLPVVRARELQTLRAAGGGPTVLDTGVRMCVPPGARPIAMDTISDAEIGNLAGELRSRPVPGAPVVLMGDGTFSAQSRALAVALHMQGFPDVRWFRGGEEAWAAAGLECQDLRRD